MSDAMLITNRSGNIETALHEESPQPPCQAMQGDEPAR